MEENNQPTSPAGGQPTNKDILDAIQFYAQAMDKNFDDFKKELKGEVGGLKGEISELKGEVGGLKNEMQRGFSSIHAELDKINNELTDIKAKLEQAIKTETEDTGAISNDYLNLAKRVKTVEEQVEQLKLQKQIA